MRDADSHADEGGSANRTIFDSPFPSVLGLVWLGYSVGLEFDGFWIAGGIVGVLGLLSLLYGEGLRVTWRKEPN